MTSTTHFIFHWKLHFKSEIRKEAGEGQSLRQQSIFDHYAICQYCMLREFITTTYIGIVVLNTYTAGALGHIGSGDNCPNDCQRFSHRYCVVSSSQCSARGQVGSGGAMV